MIAGWFLIFLLGISSAQQNHREEAICAPFLTSPTTAPILYHLQRNLTVDEEAEFSCELVLQDKYLPPQIRLTIHEGLHHLAVRHTQMGLHRARSAFRHANIMTEMIPRSADFHYRAGTWAIHPDINNAESAIFHFKEVLYGNASRDDKLTNQVRYKSWKGLVKAFTLDGKSSEAIETAVALIEEFPYDFEGVFQVKSAMNLLSENVRDRAVLAMTKADALSTTINRLASNDYSGFSIPDDKVDRSVKQYDHLITNTELLEHIQNREPFVIRLGDVTRFDAEFGWSVAQWVTDTSYLERTVRQRAGDNLDGESLVLIELPAQSGQSCTNRENGESCFTFGHGLSVRRETKPFEDVAAGKAGADIYLNVQLPNAGKDTYNPPLHLISEELPIKNSPFFAEIRENVTDINLWMGLLKSSAEASSRIHRDALDNLYFVLEGRKRFMLWDPSKVQAMHTLSATFAVHPQGLAYQLDVNKLRTLLMQMDSQLLSKLQSKKNESSSSSSLPISAQILHDLLSSPDVEYEVDSLHFSSLLSAGNPHLPSPSAVIELEPGDILYLPTGWFHRVTSFSNPNNPIHRHLAVNVWWRALDWDKALHKEVEAMFRIASELMVGCFPELSSTRSGEHQEL